MTRKDQTKPASTASIAEKLLTPAEKARQLGVSVDTLRRWENEGRINSTRTAGGQRRYRADERPRPAVVVEADHDDHDPRFGGPVGRAVSAPAVLPWQERIEERRADVEVAKLDREHRAILRAQAEEREERRRRAVEAEQQAAAERERQSSLMRESQRLDLLVQQGVMLALSAPMELQAAIRRELLAYVTTERFPARLSPMELSSLLAARVEHVLKPWRDKQHLGELMKEARSRALLATAGAEWDYDPAQTARREVEARLSREIDPSWTKGDVRSRVDELLEEWD
jgi:excisionase family DNA binding protein